MVFVVLPSSNLLYPFSEKNNQCFSVRFLYLVVKDFRNSVSSQQWGRIIHSARYCTCYWFRHIQKEHQKGLLSPIYLVLTAPFLPNTTQGWFARCLVLDLSCRTKFRLFFYLRGGLSSYDVISSLWFILQLCGG